MTEFLGAKATYYAPDNGKVGTLTAAVIPETCLFSAITYGTKHQRPFLQKYLPKSCAIKSPLAADSTPTLKPNYIV